MHVYTQQTYPRVGLLADVDLVRRGGAGELLGVPEMESERCLGAKHMNLTYSSAWAEGEPS